MSTYHKTMTKQQHVCGNIKCRTTVTPLWRKGWITEENKPVWLCNACGIHYRKGIIHCHLISNEKIIGHFCYYCYQVYRESDFDDDKNPWIGCDVCERWIHISCENAHRSTPLNSNDGYICPLCRSNPESKIQKKALKRKVPSLKPHKLKKTNEKLRVFQNVFTPQIIIKQQKLPVNSIYPNSFYQKKIPTRVNTTSTYPTITKKNEIKNSDLKKIVHRENTYPQISIEDVLEIFSKQTPVQRSYWTMSSLNILTAVCELERERISANICNVA